MQVFNAMRHEGKDMVKLISNKNYRGMKWIKINIYLGTT